MRAALGPLADASTLLLSYAQIVSSLLVALPRVEWPEPFASIARVLGVLTLTLTLTLTSGYSRCAPAATTP